MANSSDRMNWIRSNADKLMNLSAKEAVDLINAQGFDRPITESTWNTTKSGLRKKDKTEFNKDLSITLPEALELVQEKFGNDLQKAKEHLGLRVPEVNRELEELQEMLKVFVEENKYLDYLSLAVQLIEEMQRKFSCFNKAA